MKLWLATICFSSVTAGSGNFGWKPPENHIFHLNLRTRDCNFNLYTVSEKRMDSILVITLTNLDNFSQFFGTNHLVCLMLLVIFA